MIKDQLLGALDWLTETQFHYYLFSLNRNTREYLLQNYKTCTYNGIEFKMPNEESLMIREFNDCIRDRSYGFTKNPFNQYIYSALQTGQYECILLRQLIETRFIRRSPEEFKGSLCEMIFLGEKIYALFNEPYISEEDEGYFILSPSGTRSCIQTLNLHLQEICEPLVFPDSITIRTLIATADQKYLLAYSNQEIFVLAYVKVDGTDQTSIIRKFQVHNQGEYWSQYTTIPIHERIQLAGEIKLIQEPHYSLQREDSNGRQYVILTQLQHSKCMKEGIYLYLVSFNENFEECIEIKALTFIQLSVPYISKSLTQELYQSFYQIQDMIQLSIEHILIQVRDDSDDISGYNYFFYLVNLKPIPKTILCIADATRMSHFGQNKHLSPYNKHRENALLMTDSALFLLDGKSFEMVYLKSTNEESRTPVITINDGIQKMTKNELQLILHQNQDRMNDSSESSDEEQQQLQKFRGLVIEEVKEMGIVIKVIGNSDAISLVIQGK